MMCAWHMWLTSVGFFGSSAAGEGEIFFVCFLHHGDGAWVDVSSCLVHMYAVEGRGMSVFGSHILTVEREFRRTGEHATRLFVFFVFLRMRARYCATTIKESYT